jgi:transposase
LTVTKPCLFPPSVRDWLPPDHPVWLVITAVEGHLDTSAFHALRRTGGAGAAGYGPDVLVAVLVWAYAHQVTSSRRIGQLCGTDVAFGVICAGNLPDHAAVARFRAAFGGAVAAFFAGVLALCARLGMGRLGVVALAGLAAERAAAEAERARRCAAAGSSRATTPRTWPARMS